MKFYGTGAAEGLPSPFCGCYLCEYARTHGGKDMRMRSMFRLNKEVCIDLGPDTFSQAARFGDLKELAHVLVTHTHSDHFAYDVMEMRRMATVRREGPLHYYFTGDAGKIIERYENSDFILGGKFPDLEEREVIKVHFMDYGKTYPLGNLSVTPLKGNHRGDLKEIAANYLIRMADGTVLFYGCDTGPYLEETYEALKGTHIDLLISECTYGGGEDSYPNPGHLSYSTCVKVFDRLMKENVIDSSTRIFLTHINHCHQADHETLQKMFDNCGLPMKCTVAYDGLEIL